MNPITNTMQSPAGVPGQRIGQQDKTEAAKEPGVSGSAAAPTSKGGALAPKYDEYIPGEEPESAGLYQPGKDEDGNPKMMFDDPDRKAASADEDEKEGKNCTVNTDRIDAEIEKLKQKRADLAQQLSRASDDPAEQERLQSQLSQVDSELQRKDNDSYRRQNAQYSYS